MADFHFRGGKEWEAAGPSCWNVKGLDGRWILSAPRDEEADPGTPLQMNV